MKASVCMKNGSNSGRTTSGLASKHLSHVAEQMPLEVCNRYLPLIGSPLSRK